MNMHENDVNPPNNDNEVSSTNSKNNAKHKLKKFFSFFLGHSKEGSEKGLLKLKETKEQLMVLIFTFAFIFEIIVIPSIAYLYFSDKISPSSEKTKFTINSNANNEIIVFNFNEEITMNSYYKILNFFESIKDNKELKEIILVMNTPGGSPVASDEISHYLKEYSQKHKHITLYIQTMAASGGYYIASVFDEIISNPNAIVGSIGVILPKYSLEKLAKNIGVEEDPIFAGKYKHTLSIFKKSDPETKKYIQTNLLQPTYRNFLNHVSIHRNIPIDELIKYYAEGRIFSANMKIISGKLVDKIQNFNELKADILQKVVNKHSIKEEDIKFRFFMLDTLGKSNSLFNKIDLDLKINPNISFQETSLN